ncbi:CopG family transcriptional regulator [Chromatium okenii]|uniref:CopG family transcriptional regulator n=1 Tax=Chromatium okenii TaxID=61644 RepID=UPI0019034816|nr:CopG family transcriptional regulator [Chromatium okenii]MBK1641462.1 CopG family transcriptional regulator [Chromatium okenii]
MNSHATRSTLYLDPTLHQALCCKAANTHRSISEIVNDAIRLSLQENEGDLAAFADRAEEPTLSDEAFLA